MALDDNGKVLLKKKFTQKQLITFTANLQTSLIGMEACGGAHFLGRALRAQGHDVKLIPAQLVKPFVKSNKNDFIDAEAIAEAVDRQNIRFVPIKTDDQLDLQALHRVRDHLITRRTSVINQLRAFLLERGLVFAKSPARLQERTVTTAYLKPDFSNGSYTAEGFCRTGTLRISSWRGDKLSTDRPDTLTQTFLHPKLFPCSRAADHTFEKLRI